MEGLAPIILFVYNRPRHTQKVIQALKLAEYSDKTDLIIFADGPKPSVSEDEIQKIHQVRDVIKNIEGFKSVSLFLKESNSGLADSIINGVREILKKYDKVITLEDDVVVGKHFISYMNNALDKYADSKNVFMVSGYGFNLPFSKWNKSSFFLPTGSTQAWGTWKRVWDNIDFSAEGYEVLKTDAEIRRKFDINGCIKYSDMLINQMESNPDKISSWAIRFRWSLFKNNGICLFPPHNLINNIGWDGSGKHSGTHNPYRDDVSRIDMKVTKFPEKTQVKKIYLYKMYLFFYRMFYYMKVKDYFRNKLK